MYTERVGVTLQYPTLSVSYWILDYAGLSCFRLEWKWCFWVIILKYLLLLLSAQNETRQWGLQLCRVWVLPITAQFPAYLPILSPCLTHWLFLSASYHAPSSYMEKHSLTITQLISAQCLSPHESLPCMTVSCLLWWVLILSCSSHSCFNFVLMSYLIVFLLHYFESSTRAEAGLSLVRFSVSIAYEHVAISNKCL